MIMSIYAIMLIYAVMLFSGLILMYLKGYSVISVNPELVNIIGLSLMFTSVILIIRKALKMKPLEKKEISQFN